MKEVQQVLFDLDGTLVDSRPGIEASGRVASEAVWPGRAPVSLAAWIGPPLAAMLHGAFPGASDDELSALERAFRADYDAGGWRRTTPYRGARAVLRCLGRAGLRCYLATNKPALATAAILDHLGLAPYLEAVICPDSRRPAFTSKAEMLSCLLETQRLPRGTSIYVGDSIADRDAAIACGLAFVAAAYGFGTAGSDGEWPGTPAIQALEELPGLLGLDRHRARAGRLRVKRSGKVIIGDNSRDITEE